MQITHSSADASTATTKGPAQWFTGDVYIDPVAASPAPSRVQANLVHFMPGARTAWHRHPLGQTLFVTEGIGLCQRRGGPVEITLTREDVSTVSPADSLVITEQSEGLTSFDVHLSAYSDITYEASFPHASLAGRIFRELTFTPSWHTGMLLLQEIPFLQATVGEIRFQTSDGTLALPGYMLAHLDYTRSASPGSRVRLYDLYATAMNGDSILVDQFLLRMRQEIHVIPPGIIIQLLRKIGLDSPTKT